MKINKNIIVFIVVLSLMLTLFLGCTKKAETTETTAAGSGETTSAVSSETTSSQAEKPYDGVEISFATQAVPLMNKAIELLPEFEKKTGIKVKVDAMPYDAMVQKITIDTTTGTKQYDTFWIEPTWYGRFQNEFEDLTPYINDPVMGKDANWDDFDKNYISQAGMYKDMIFGFPFDACDLLIAYREDIYKELNLSIPVTWDEYLANIKTISEKKPDIKGVSLMGKRGQPVFYEFMPYFWGFGGEFFDSNMKPTINTPEAISALEYMIKLSKNAPSGIASFGWEESATEFLQGRVANAMMFTDWISTLKDPASSKVKDVWNFMVTPEGVNQASPIGTECIGINKDVDPVKKKAAFEFVKWITGREMEKELAKIGGAPCRIPVLKDSEFKGKSEYKYFETIEKTFPILKLPMNIPEFFKLNEALSVELSAAVAGEKEPKAALDSAQKAWEQIMKDAGY